MRLAKEAGRSGRGVVYALADLRVDHPHHGPDQRPRRVVLAAVAPGVAHVADLGLVQVRKLVLLVLRAETQRIHQLQRVAQAVAAGELVADLAEDLADLVLDRIRPGRPLAEALQVRKQLAVDELDQIGPGQRAVVVEFPVILLRRRPRRPAKPRLDDERIPLPDQLGLLRPLVLQIVQVLQKQHPRRLLRVIQLRRTARPPSRERRRYFGMSARTLITSGIVKPNH